MYLGRNPAVGTQKMLDNIESQFNGTLTTFNLRYDEVPTYPTLSESLIVSLGGVLQEPGEAYYVSSDKIVFSEAPPAGAECWILLYSQYGAAASSTPSLAIQATGEPMGFENRTHSSISFDNGTRTFSIAPNTSGGYSSYAVWTKGTKRTISATLSVQVGTSTGLYYIYFDAFGDLKYKTTYFTWDTETMVAYVYWNSGTSSAPFIADERHGVVLDWQTHEYLHRTRGAVIAEGFSISAYTTTGNGNVDAHAQFDLGNGTFFDEDLEVNITHSATPTTGTFTQVLTGGAEIPVFYMNGSAGAWVKDSATKYACKQSATTLQYNLLSGSTWSTTPADNNRYVVSWIAATNDINAPVICILGQSQYTDIGSAEAVKFGNLTLTNFPIVEFRPLWKVIFQTSTGFTNTPNALIANVLDLRQLSETGEAGTLVSDHGLLTGLADDDHSQYLHTTFTRAGITANISTTGNLGGANLTLTGELRGPSTLVIDPATVGDDTGLVRIKGDLEVLGATTNINSTTLVIEDKNIILGDTSSPTDSSADGGGITLKGTVDKTFVWLDATDAWTSSERISIPLGSAGAPSLTFTGDPNTGIYSPGADQVAISTGGSGRLFVDASGNVGINTASTIAPGGFGYAREFALTGATSGDSSAAINIRGSRTISGGFGDINFWHQSTSNRAYIQARRGSSDSAIDLDFITSGGAGMRITSAGLVGVGTNSPSSLLDVGSGNAVGVTQLTLKGGTTAGDYGILSIQNGSTSRGRLVADAGVDELRIDTAGGASTKIQFKTGSGYTNALTIDASQRVGIGVSSPGATLHLAGGSAQFQTNLILNASTHATSRRTTISFNGDWLLLTDTFGNGTKDFSFYSSALNANPFIINTTGNVGIGTTNPGGKLDVRGRTNLIAGGSGWDDGLNLYSSDATNRWNLLVDDGASDAFRIAYNNSERFRLESGGNIAFSNGTGFTYNSNTIWHAGNDGVGSGLDADLLDGINSSSFVYDRGVNLIGATSSWDVVEPGMYGVASASSFTGTNNPSSALPGIYSYGVLSVFESNGNGIAQLYTPHSGNKIALRTGWDSSNWYGWQQIWTSTSDGAGSGLDADLLDGLNSTSFVRSDADTTLSGNYTFSSTSLNAKLNMSGQGGAANYNYFLNGWNDTGVKAVHFVNGSTRSADGGPNTYTIRNDGGSLRLGQGSFSTLLEGSALTYNSNTVWHAGNDGSGSGLDADLWDGYHLSTRTNWSSNSAINIVVGQLAWKNYGNSHTIFDASQSTSPDGTSVNNTNPQIAWASTYPTLMGWNGASTYGVRVDSARNADGAASVSATADGAIANQHNGNASTWYGRILCRNSTSDRSVFLGTWGTATTGIFAHNNALNAWAPLYINTTNGVNDGSDVTIAGSGRVGIGVATPLQKLDVRGSFLLAADGTTATHITQRPYTINNGTLSWEGSAGQLFSITNNLTSGSIFSVNDVSGIPSIDVDANGTIELAPFGGNVGVGTTNPTTKLHVIGDILASGNVTAYSDSQLKDNVETIDKPLEKVLGLRGVTFTRVDIEDKDKKHVGVIAQEVEQVLPEVVLEHSDGIKSVAYGNMVGLLIEAIKEQQNQIESLKAEIESLKRG